MGRRRKGALPARVGVVQRKIEKWRRTREKRTRMPEELWSAAVELGRAHGVWRIAQELKVRYESLKERVVAANAGETKRGRSGHGDAELVEVLPGWMDAGGPQCIVEQQDRGGATMTIRLTDAGAVDVAALMETFWRRRRR